MSPTLPEKARLLEKLNQGNFNVPDFIYVPAADFRNENFKDLESFIISHRESFKVIARSGHPQEEFYKGGTFDSLETYADVGGIKYARKRMITSAKSSKRLSILRQQKFNNAPDIDLDEMGVVVMPYIDGINVMAKKLGKQWEFGYSFNRNQQVQKDPYVTQTPHDRKLLQVSEDIQNYLGFRCEIEYIISEEGDICVVQAKDISHIDTLMLKESERSIRLDGLRRIRKRRSYRERPIFIMDSITVYLDIITKCENLVLGGKEPVASIDDILATISAYDNEMETFALRHERFGILGVSIQVPEDLFQIANHYLDDTPDFQKQLSKALHNNLYRRDYFLSEADTLIAKDKIRFNLGTHSAYGVDTVRNPLWSVYWHADRHDFIIKEVRRIGFATGDTIGIDIDVEEKPTVYRL